jgi:hypothetical protein
MATIQKEIEQINLFDFPQTAPWENSYHMVNLNWQINYEQSLLELSSSTSDDHINGGYAGIGKEGMCTMPPHTQECDNIYNKDFSCGISEF